MPDTPRAAPRQAQERFSQSGGTEGTPNPSEERREPYSPSDFVRLEPHYVRLSMDEVTQLASLEELIASLKNIKRVYIENVVPSGIYREAL